MRPSRLVRHRLTELPGPGGWSSASKRHCQGCSLVPQAPQSSRRTLCQVTWPANLTPASLCPTPSQAEGEGAQRQGAAADLSISG